MNRRLYVGNLNFSTSESDLHNLFSEVAPVASISMVTDRETGRPRGFAFVEMETSEGAEQAIEKLNNREVDSRTITVSEARPKKEGSGDRGDRGGFGGGGRRRF